MYKWQEAQFHNCMICNYYERKLSDYGTQSYPQILHHTETTPHITTQHTLLGPQTFNNPLRS